MELSDLQYFEDLLPKFLAFPIFGYYKEHIYPSGRFLKLITHQQNVVNNFGTTSRW